MRIAITGTLGAGKSTVAQILRNHGYDVIDADGLAKSYYGPNSPVYDRLYHLLKKYNVFDTKGQLDISTFSTLFFNEPALKDQVTEILYTQMRKDFSYLGNTIDPFIAEVPLLFEAKMEDLFDHILVVTTSKNTVLQRIGKSRNMDAKQYDKRMAYQYDDAYKIDHGDTVIENDGTMDALERKVMAWIKHLIDLD